MVFLCGMDIHGRHVIVQEARAEVIAIRPCNSTTIFQRHLTEIGIIIESTGDSSTNERTNVDYFAKPICKYNFEQAVFQRFYRNNFIHILLQWLDRFQGLFIARPFPISP